MTPFDKGSGDAPKAGYYLVGRVKDGPLLPVKIWRGVTPDPNFPDNPQDRSPGWNCLRAGEEVPVEWVWPWAGSRPISEADYRYRLDVNAWDRKYAPTSPAANPGQAVDLNKLKPLF